tara:strand:+ start:1208 stop:2038 length:831 start_codon:yes stop_codon:yes gene_type:complete
MNKIPTLAACLVLAAATLASARPLTAKEQSYARTLADQIGLRRTSTKALSSKSGAAGVKVSFKELTVIRLHFPTAHAARRYAARPSLRGSERSPRQVDLRGKEIVLLGGEGLRDSADAGTYLGAAWGASIDAPSTTSPPLVKRADGTSIRLRPITRRAPREVAPSPSAATLGGTYYLVGSSQVVIDQVQAGPDGIKCRVTFEGGGASRSFPAVFDGQVLAIKVRVHRPGALGKHLPSEVLYIWSPNSKGGPAFVRSGVECELLPSASERFWHAKGH